MYDENTQPTQNFEAPSRIEINLSTGEHLIFKADKELTWADFEKYQDLGAGLKGKMNTEDKSMEVDFGDSARQTRAQKLFLIRFFWDAYNVNFGALKIKEVEQLYNPIRDLNPLAGIKDVLAD